MMEYLVPEKQAKVCNKERVMYRKRVKAKNCEKSVCILKGGIQKKHWTKMTDRVLREEVEAEYPRQFKKHG